MYNKVDNNLFNKLEQIVGADFLSNESEILQNNSKDNTENLSFLPEVVIRPGNSTEISQILQLANEYKIPVVARGGGTGLSGGVLPIFGGICILMDRFNRI